jgi:alcohol dehydrogenase
MKDFQYHSPTKIIFGNNKLEEIAEFVPATCERILVITGKHSSKANGSLDLLVTSLQRKHISIFDEVEENPSARVVNSAARMARQQRADLVIGLGGGSPMDTSKFVAMLTTNEGNIEEYLDGKTPEHEFTPIIAVPTTAGTGSEVTQHAVVTRDLTKKGHSTSGFFPETAILDPTLSLSIPREITVDTGIDALTHAIEGYLSLRATPVSDSLAIEAIRITKEWLPRAASNGKDVEARSRMLYASLLAGLVISQSGTIVLHALGYSLTTFHGLPHGRANGILLPTVLEFLSSRKSSHPLDKKLALIAEVFGSPDEAREFVTDLGVSTKLSDHGVGPQEVPRFVQDVLGRRNLPLTPVKITKQDIEKIYTRAL